MKYIILIACCCLAYWLYEDISNIPFSQMTLKMIGNNLFAMIIVYVGFLGPNE